MSSAGVLQKTASGNLQRLSSSGTLHRASSGSINSLSSGYASLHSSSASLMHNEVYEELECGGLTEEMPLPETEPISQRHWGVASTWMGTLGRDLATCLVSKEWGVRDIALKRLARELANAMRSGGYEWTEKVERLWRCAADVLAKAMVDKVFRVYLSAIKCLRTTLVFTRRQDDSHLHLIRASMKPIVQGILARCTDGNRRIAELSIDTI